MGRRPLSGAWTAHAPAELEQAAFVELALVRGLVDLRVAKAARKPGGFAALVAAIPPARIPALRDEARSRVRPCPHCRKGFVRDGRPRTAKCVACGADPPPVSSAVVMGGESVSRETMAESSDSSEDATETKSSSVALVAELAEPPPPPDPPVPVTPPNFTRRKTTRERPAATLEPRPGDRIGPYTLVREVGRGGMGLVFEAEKENHFRVALKLTKPGISASSRERFIREGHSAARLDHPNLVKVYEVGNSDSGPWIAMEYVEGVALDDFAGDEPLPLNDALEIVERVARGMDHAHRRGLIHRDLKPANVLIGNDGSVKVADFGLAKDYEHLGNHTRDGITLGTPSYMAPEQVQGQSDRIGVAADVHAIGAILYQLVTGDTPFKGKKIRDVFLAILRETHVPPSAAKPELGLPRSLDAVIARALAKRAGDRYATAHELAEDLAAMRRGQMPRYAAEERTSTDPALALAWGDRVGPYEVRYPIGRGGVAVVFKAVAGPALPQPLVPSPMPPGASPLPDGVPSGSLPPVPEGTTVALKILRPKDGERRRRFEREVRILAFLNAEGGGFVPLLDQGESAVGPWLAMPLLQGGTLRDRLERGPLGEEKAVAVVRAVAVALARAHVRGIAHRDLKPENVLFTDDGQPLIADLGLARHYDRGLAGTTESITISRDGQILGTVGYVAPEQLNDPRTVGPATDVFALGAILYECLSGMPALRASNAGALRAKLTSATYEPLGAVAPKVPEWLAELVGRALRADPAERYRDAAHFVEALDEALERSRAPGGIAGALARVKSMFGAKKKKKRGEG